MTSLDPSRRIFVTGNYVISRVFGLPAPTQADVVCISDSAVPTATIRATLRLPAFCTLAVRFDEPAASLNCDYWSIERDDVPRTLNSRYPISRRLYPIERLTAEQSVRFIALAVTYPWDEIDPRLEEAVQIARSLRIDDPAAAELWALYWSNGPSTDLIQRAQAKQVLTVET